MTIFEAARSLRARSTTSLELTTAALTRIDSLNPSLRAFLTITAERALADASRADAELAAGRDRGPLHGIPIAVKDLFAIAGVPNTAASLVYRDRIAASDCAVVERLVAAGAVMMGTLNMHELAYGITSANPHFGAVRNPWNKDRSPGGSSGGSGAAVVADLVFAAMGSDTGGSIRIPASFCGAVGLKPTYGRVSRYGVLPLGQSLDHMGPLARTVRDAAVVLNAIAGFDSRDPASSRRPVADFVPAAACDIRGLRIGFSEAFFFERIEPDVERAVRAALARAQALGAKLQPVRVPDLAALNAVGQVILLSEAAAVLAPYHKRRELFGEDVLALLDQGSLIPATDYIQAQRLRRSLAQDFAKIWSEADCLFTPATAITAPPIGQTTVTIAGTPEPVRPAATRMSRPFNVLGLPAISIPCGLDSSGLPIGLQIVAPPFEEASLLRVGAALEDSGIGVPALQPDKILR
jgi:aspartyl-tRNA(Asn)/glutamyl-tRNA(Gln) amidotransferase subunit A